MSDPAEDRRHELHRWLRAEGCMCQPVEHEDYDLCECGASKEAHLPRCRACWLRWRREAAAV